jgi:hypothetical protein
MADAVQIRVNLPRSPVGGFTVLLPGNFCRETKNPAGAGWAM